ncbi:MAG: hypothetical protein QOD07_1876 [Frankiaceae bacterium]|jgi:putative FmdB family regulatory protein|nr:hypothetical protein [Frankiaceae bacterium]
MPTYQYACTECGERLEVVQKFTDDPLTVCPACEGRLRKLFSPVGVVFKGSGFYKTDSRGTAKSGSAPAKSEPAAASSEKSGSGEASSTGGSSPAPTPSSPPSSPSSGPSGDGTKVA